MSEEKASLPLDRMLLFLILTLAGLGLVMMLSASTFWAEYRHMGDGFHFFRSQAVNMLIGLAAMLLLYRIPYQFWLKWVYPILLGAMFLLALVHVPGIGLAKGEAKRWILLAGFSFQPSEAAKLAVVIYMAYSLSRKGEKTGSFIYGFLPHLIVLGLLSGLILTGRDLGTAACVVVIAFIMMFVAGTKIWHMMLLGLAAAPLLYWQIVSVDYRMNRITAFLNPWLDPEKTGYQIIHSFYAFASGGVWGQGPGAGIQKLLFLPEPHTDFIFAVVAEELGLIGVIIIGLIFLALICRGLCISRSAPDFFGVYLALGCTLIVGMPAFFNMCVVTGLLPNKGLPLPFFSYGGSNLLICFAAMGFLLNVAAQSRDAQKAPAPKRRLTLRAPRLAMAALDK